MKHLTALLILFLVCAWAQTTRAQTTDSWVNVSLPGDDLTVWMPQTHKSQEIQDFRFDKFKLDGRVYAAKEEGAEFIVMSLIDKGDAENSPSDYGAYEDTCADLVWKSLLKPYRDQFSKEPERVFRMVFQREVFVGRLLPGRQYGITIGGKPGVTRFFVAEQQIYVLIALNLEAKNSAAAQRFIYSFGPKTATPPDTSRGIGSGGGLGPAGGIGPGEGGGIGPGRAENIGGGDRVLPGSTPGTLADGPTDYNRVFTGKEVIQRARILSKPEPSYTESARQYAVQGTVVIRAVFSGSGEVTQIKVLRGLPHGLTKKALAAAKGIKFVPAVKDGHNVSMWFQLEYNFNLY